MRKLKLLIAACALLGGVSSANAQASYNTSWTEGVEITEGYDYYLYNIGSGTFLTGGMDWGSRASGDHAGKTVEFRSAGEGVYKIWSYYYSPNGLSNDGWLGTNSYLDAGDNDIANCVFAKVDVDGYTNAYSIKDNVNNKFLYYNPDDTRVNWGDEATNNYAYWLIIPKASRDAIGDYTYYIQNVGINRPWERQIWCGYTWNENNRGDWKTYDNNGWSNHPYYTVGGNDNNPCGEKYHRVFDFYQTISKSLPEGRYRLYAQAFWRDGSSGESYLYLSDSQQPLVQLNANGEGTTESMAGASTAFSAGQYVNSVEKFLSTATTDVRIGINMTTANQWVIFDNFYLENLGKVVMDYAEALPASGEMAADTWYYFDIAAAADNYAATATTLADIICVTDEYTKTSATSGTVTLTAEDNSFAAGRYYVKSSSANNLVVDVASFSYNISEPAADIAYIQPGQTVTVSYTVGTNDPDATLAQDYSGVTFNGAAVTCTATESGFTFVVPEGLAAATAFTLAIPANAIGYAAGSAYNAAQEITLTTPAIFDGTYFFKVANETAAKGLYLARGNSYGTHATIDIYGLPIIVATDANNVTTLSPADTKRYYFHDSDYDCWADAASAGDAAKFTITLSDGTYRIHNNTMSDGLYLKYTDTELGNENVKVYDDGNGTNAGPIIEWILESLAEHATAMQALKDNQAATAATAAYASGDYASLNGITTVAALEAELTANYIQGDFVAPSEISSVSEKYQGGQPGSGNTTETVYSNTIEITKAGFYKFSMQAFYRAASNANTQAMHTAGADFPPVALFFGDAQTQIKSLYDEAGSATVMVEGNDAQYNGQYYANNTTSALQMFKAGKFHNDVWLYVSTPGTYTYGVKYMGFANVNMQWFIYSPESVTITSYSAAADADDYAALNAAIAASEGKTLGFEAGEYAPYNNATAFAALAAAKAIDQTATNSKLLVESAIANMDTWVANTEEVNAFADPTFEKSGNDGAQLGWITDDSAGLGGSYHARAFVLESGATNYDNLAAFGQGDGTRAAGYFRFDGTNSAKTTTYTYGETDGYTVPLKAKTYNLTAQLGGWGQVDKNAIVQVVNADGDVVGSQTVHTPNTGVNAGGSVVDVNFVFQLSTAGNYKVQLKNGSTDADNAIVISNLDLRIFSPVYAVVGSSTDLFSGSWDQATQEDYMTLTNGVYTKTYTDVILDKQTIEYKVIKKDYVESTSATNWYGDGENNKTLSIPVKGQYDITFTFTEEGSVVTGVATKTAEAVTIGEKGWATTVTNSALNFAGAQVEAYTATVSDSKVVLAKVDDVQAETGLVLKGAEGTYYIPVAESSTTDNGSLMFSSTLTYTTWHDNGGENNKFYGLTVNTNNDAQFALISCSAENEVVIPAQKAFLLINSASAARELSIVFEDGTTTGISAVAAENGAETVYNLQGQRVSKAQKGLFIVNGKKVVRK